MNNACKIIRTIGKSSRSGFTLVELLLVVAILGILAGVVVVNVSGHSDRARVAATRASISSIKTAIDAYEIEASRLPDSLEVLTVATETRAGYLDKDNLNDAWGTPLSYKKTSNFEYEIRSAGPDGQMNNEDDITN